MIQPYIKSTQIYDCPSGTKNVVIYPGGSFLDITTYSYGFVTPSSDVNPVGVASRPLAVLEDTATTIALVEDGRQDAGLGAETQGRLIPNVGESLSSLGGRLNGMRHTGASDSNYGDYAFNVLYADGHAKWKRLTDVWDGGAMTQWTIAAD